MDFSAKTCTSCEGNISPLTPKQIEERLKTLPDWQLSGNGKIFKEFVFKNFKEALTFVNKVGEIAETEGHHPDIHLVAYKKVIVELWTHAIGGLSENDFIVGAKVETLLR